MCVAQGCRVGYCALAKADRKEAQRVALALGTYEAISCALPYGWRRRRVVEEDLRTGPWT